MATLAMSSSGWTQESSGYALEEITVTARKIEEGLQDAPLAVTALTGQELANRGALDITDATASVPNVHFETGGSASGFSAMPTVFIRGIGQADFVINADPAVGIYTDGVYLGRTAGSVLDLLDVERIEILRGPQGTLFGRNSIGGAVNLVSKVPDAEDGFTGDVTAAFGERDYTLFKAVANLPIADGSAARVSGFVRQRDGFIDALQYDDFELGEEEVWGVRGALRFEPADALSIDLSIDYSEREDSPSPRVAVALASIDDPQSGAEAAAAAPGFNGGVDPMGNPVPPENLVWASPIVPQCLGNLELQNTNENCYGNVWIAGSDAVNAVWVDRDGNPIEPTQTLDVLGASAIVSLDLPIGTLKSTTAYREFDSTFFNDGDFTPFIINANLNELFEQEQFSQELQLTGRAFDDGLDYVLGVYYFEEDGQQTLTLLEPAAAPMGMNPPSAVLPRIFTTDRFIDNQSIAAYAHGTAHLSDRTRLSLGARITDDEKDVTFRQLEDLVGVGEVVTTADGNANANEWTYLANLARDLTDTVMAYVQFSNGFRVGGFPSRFPGGLVTPLPDFGPEFVDAYEIGLKSQLFDDRMRLNIAAFVTDYEDIQVEAGSTDPALGGTATIQNLGDATISGIEVEANIVPVDNLRFDLSISYLDDEIDSLLGGSLQSGMGPPERIIITEDHDLPFTPELRLSIGGNYSYALAGGGEIRTRIDYHWVDDQHYEIENTSYTFEESYSVLDGSISYRSPDARWEFTLGGRNLTDEDYSVDRERAIGPASASRVRAREREVYGQVRYSY